MDWLQFEFDYRLDLQRLTPHLLALEAHKPEALTRVLPPQWRECAPGTLRSLPVQVGRREVGGLHMGAPANHLHRLMDEYVGFITSDRVRSLHPVLQALIA